MHILVNFQGFIWLPLPFVRREADVKGLEQQSVVSGRNEDSHGGSKIDRCLGNAYILVCT